MTTSAQILEAFKSNVFDDATIKAITEKAYQFDIAANVDSMSALALLHQNTDVNFFSYTTYREQLTGDLKGNGSGVTRFRHTIEISYYIECKTGEPDRNYNAAISAIETVDDLIRSAMGKTWDGTVDFYDFVEIRRPELIDINGNGLKVWKIGHVYRGIKQI